MKELREEVTRLKSDFEQKWSSQIKMVNSFNSLNLINAHFRSMQTIEVSSKCMIK